MNANIYTLRQLARKLRCGNDEVKAVADRYRLPYDLRHGVDGKGEPTERRVYLRAEVDAALDERGRQSVREAS